MGTMSGKVCLVTGGTSGIGKETALQLAVLGAAVTIVARDEARGEAAAAEIRRRVPLAQVGTMTADLSSLAQVRRLAEEVLARPGPAAGARTSVYLASSAEVAAISGAYFVKSRVSCPSALARDAQAAARLWALSAELTGLSPGR